MIGNDVVDLCEAETYAQAQHPGFDRRVFREAERDVIAGAADPRSMRWVLWAAKEAAYKALRRDDPAFVFSPCALAVEIDDAGRGQVTLGAQTLSLRVDADQERVAALALRPEIQRAAVSLHAIAHPGDRGALRAAFVEPLRREAARRCAQLHDGCV